MNAPAEIQSRVRPWKLWPMGAAALVDRLRALPPAERRALYDEIRQRFGLGALADLKGDRERFWYRDAQRVTDDELRRKKMVVFVGNRGDGKTEAAVYLFDRLIRTGVAKRPRLFGAKSGDVDKITIHGPSGILSLYDDDDPRRPRWLRAEGPAGILRYPNGVEVVCFSAEVAKAAVGYGGDVDLYDDVTKWSGKEEAWNHARTSCREGIGLGIVATSAGEGEQEIWALLEGSADSQRALIKNLGWDDSRPPVRPNLFNLSYAYYEQLEEELGESDFYRREMFGEKVSATSPFTGLSFNTAPIRILSAPRGDFAEVVIAVDPAEGKGGDHDEWGIGAAGRRHDRHIVALDDASGPYDDDEAAAEVMRLCEVWGASKIVVESNRGKRVRNAIVAAYYQRELEAAKSDGEMVSLTMPEIIPIQAKDGKALRAGPLRVLYLQGTLHHVAGLARLEKQQREWKPKGPKRPRQDDRIDWLVHAVHYLADLGELGGLKLEHVQGLGDRAREVVGRKPKGQDQIMRHDKAPPGDPRSAWKPRGGYSLRRRKIL